MSGHQPTPITVVVVHQERRIARAFIVDDDHRQAVGLHDMALIGTELRRAQDDAVHPALHHGLHDFFLALLVTMRSGHKQTITGRMQHLVNALYDFHPEWIVDVTDDYAQGASAPCL